MIDILSEKSDSVNLEMFTNFNSRVKMNLDDQNEGLVCWSLIYFAFIFG